MQSSSSSSSVTWVYFHLSTKQSKSIKNYFLFPGALLHRPDAFGLLQLPQILIPLGELLWQQEHLPIRSQRSESVGGALSCQQFLSRLKHIMCLKRNVRGQHYIFAKFKQSLSIFSMRIIWEINVCTILLYSSKSFFTSWDWTSVWSCQKKKSPTWRS